jgi:hypothetical protein
MRKKLIRAADRGIQKLTLPYLTSEDGLYVADTVPKLVLSSETA